ncbi:MAG: TetR/AcrR family transcriptional regulator [Ideonella sp.]|nr:TetR/AcrR family transcriptional regulator [Ideonella sp.]MCC7455873.1 TetR/AcrR family transcriptional regulator [Nitrospira sp.]
MARPSQHIDRALLAAGRALYPRLGCAGLSVRALAERAGANPAMFHYHFKTKDQFLRTLLQQLYEDLFATLDHGVALQGPAIERLRSGLNALARFARDHRPLLSRVWADAVAGHVVAREFVRANAPRHVGLLLHWLAQAEHERSLAAMPPLQRLSFVMGSVMAPMMVLSNLATMGVAPGLLTRELDPQVTSDAAIAARVDLALQALRPTTAPTTRRRTHA